MNKKSYCSPQVRMETAQQSQMLCESVITKIDGDGIGYGGSDSGPARTPECDDWDIWSDE